MLLDITAMVLFLTRNSAVAYELILGSILHSRCLKDILLLNDVLLDGHEQCF